jgi:hypothetical protein
LPVAVGVIEELDYFGLYEFKIHRFNPVIHKCPAYRPFQDNSKFTGYLRKGGSKRKRSHDSGIDTKDFYILHVRQLQTVPGEIHC